MSKGDIVRYVTYVSGDYKCLMLLYKYVNENFMVENTRILNLVNCIVGILLFEKSIDDKKYEQLIKISYVSKMNYIKKIYTKEIIENEYNWEILN